MITEGRTEETEADGRKRRYGLEGRVLDLLPIATREEGSLRRPYRVLTGEPVIRTESDWLFSRPHRNQKSLKNKGF